MLERSIVRAPVPAASMRASTGRDRMVETNEFKQARTTIHKPVGLSRSAWIGLGVLAAIVLALAGYGIYRMRARTEAKLRVPFERVEVTKLTTNGNALMGALSPDGKYVAYVTGESGKSLWLRQVDINSNAQLIAPREGRISASLSRPTAITSTLVMRNPLATTPDKSTGCRYSESARQRCGSSCRKDSQHCLTIANAWLHSFRSSGANGFSDRGQR